jgi:DNA polymerase-3 subunit delta
VPGRPSGWRTLWAGDDPARLGAAVADLASPTLFGGEERLVIRRADALSAADDEHVAAGLATLRGRVRLVLVAGGADGRRKVVAASHKAGVALGFPRQTDPRVAREWTLRLAREAGHEITPAAVQELLDRTGTSIGALAGELEKLGLHAGPGTRLDVPHVRAVVTHARTHAVDELTDRLARGDVAGTLRALRRVLAAGEPPVKVLAFVAANLRRSLHVAELVEQGLSPDEIARTLGMPPWLVTKTQHRAPAHALRRLLRALRDLDLALKTSRPPEASFEAALLSATRDSVPARGE